MKKNRDIRLGIYFILVLFTGLVAQPIENKKELKGSKKALLITSTFPTYTTQIMTMIMMLNQIGYEASVYVTKIFCSKTHDIMNLYKDLGIVDVYDRIYYPNQSTTVINKLRQGYFDLVMGMQGERAVEFAQIKKENNLNFYLLARYTGADISSNHEQKKKNLEMYGKYIDQFLPVSGCLRTLLIEAGIPKKKITVLPTPTILSLFSPQADNKREDEFRVLSVGRLIEKKGFDCAIRAFAELTKVYPFIFYDIVGDGVEKNALSKLIKDLGCQKNVRLLGKVFLSRLPAIYSQADLLLVPSRIGKSGNREGIARVAKEAMAMNVPVVATDCSGVQEMVTHKESGFIIRPDMERDIMEIITYILSHRYLLKDITGKARKIIVDKHSVEAATSLLKAIIS